MSDSGKWYPVIYFNTKNKNGRVYTQENINHDVVTGMMEKIDNGRFYGELGHPDRMDVSVHGISHIVDEVEIHSDIAFAKVRVLDTQQSGQTLQALIDSGCDIVFRPRGAGTVDEHGNVDLKQIFAFDALPSNDDAFMDMQHMYDKMFAELRTDDLMQLNDEFRRKNTNDNIASDRNNDNPEQ